MVKTFTKFLAVATIGLLPFTGRGQTNPTVQTLPYTQNFAGFNGAQTTYPAGIQGWTVPGSLGTTVATAAPDGNVTLAGGTNNTASGGVYDMNGKIGILSTGSAIKAVALSVNTSGLSNIQVSFVAATQAQLSAGRIDELSLQYRAGTTGAFTSVAASEYRNTALATTTSASTTSSDPVTITVTLPAGAENQAILQLRWIIRDVSGSGNRPSFSVDDISLSSAPACTGPTTTGTTFTSGSITTTTAAIGFSGGNGTSRVAFLKSGAFTTALPAANTTYAADPAFTSATSTAFDGGKTIYNDAATTTTVTGLTPNTVYNAKVFEYLGAAGAECYNNTSLTGSFTTLSTPAATTAATLIQSGGFTANWTAPAGIGAAAYTYSLEVASDPAFANPVTGAPFSIPGGTLSYTVTGLNAATPYHYRVTVVNAGGNSVLSNVTTVTTNAPLPPCAAPAIGGAIVLGTPTNSVISGSFAASAGGADGYTVFISTNATAPVLINGTTYTGNNPAGYTVVQSGTALSFSAGSLQPNTTYYIYVAAYNTNVACTGGPAYAATTNANATTAAGVVVPEGDGDFRTTSTGNWPGTPAATWQKRISGIWTTNAAPAVNYTGGKIIIRHAITTNGSFASPEIAVDNGGTFTIATANVTASSMHIYDGGTLQVNAALTVNNNFDVEDNGTLNLNYASAINTSPIWNGTENFRPNSVVNVQNWNYGGASGTKRLIANPSQITANTNGYQFGNLIFSGTPTSIFGMIDGNQTIKLTEKDFTVNNGSATVNVTFNTASASVEIGGNLIVNTNQFSFSAANPTAVLTHTIRGSIQLNGTAVADLNQNSSGGTNTQINLYGDLEVAAGALLKNNNIANLTSSINFLGAGKHIDIRNTSTHSNFVFNINTTSKISLFTSATISNLTLTNGIFDLGTKTLTISAPSTGNGIVSAGSAGSFVQGNLVRNTNSTAAYAFPVGMAGYAPVTIQPSNATTGSYSVTFHNAFHQTPNYTVVTNPLKTVSATEYYDIAHPTGTGTATVTLPWGASSGVTNPANIVLAHYNGAAWESLGGTPSGTTTSGTVTLAGVSAFSPFAIGAITAAQPLPVHLSAFNIYKESNTAHLSWTLETTDGTEAVSLERSIDNGKTYGSISIQPVAKALKIAQSYTDAAPGKGTNLYRLAITASHGETAYSSVLSAVFGSREDLRIYPIPANTYLQADWADEATPVTIEVHNTIGQLIASQLFKGTTHATISVAGFAAGSYIITWQQGIDIVHRQVQVSR